MTRKVETCKTEQESFWAGGFGDEYIARNRGEALLAAKTSLFARMLSRTGGIASALELGANIGLNLRAMQVLFPGAELAAVEINRTAAERLRLLDGVEVFCESILDFNPKRTWELVFTSGVLIHINPECLNSVYELMYRTSSSYLAIVEYYNPEPVEVLYRGNRGKLFKRDFAGEMMDIFNNLELVDYGFVYHRDPVFPQDDVSWFLLHKSC